MADDDATALSVLHDRVRALELLGCLALLCRQLDGFLTEVEYEAELGAYNPRAVALVSQRITLFTTLVAEDYGDLLRALSYAGEFERWTAWLARAVQSPQLPDQTDPDSFFPSGRPVAEVRWQLRQWMGRLGEVLAGEEIRDRPGAPRCFMSYCSQPEDRVDWVRRLATSLQHLGVRVLVDLWDLLPGHNLGQFMEQGISQADCVVVVCTPEYKRKADYCKGGVGRESTIISLGLYEQLQEKRVIPVLCGDYQDSWPIYLGDIVYVDFRDDSRFKQKVEELARAIYQIPRFRRPSLAPSPFLYLQ